MFISLCYYNPFLPATSNNYTKYKQSSGSDKDATRIETLKDLQAAAPQINWTRYLQTLVSPDINENEPIRTSIASFIMNVALLVSNTSKRVMANYFIWRMVLQSLPKISEEWLSARRKKRNKKDEVRNCFPELLEPFKIAVLSFYVQHYFKNESFIAVSEIANYTRNAFANSLRKTTWIEENTKSRAIEKHLQSCLKKVKLNKMSEFLSLVESVAFQIGCFPEILNNTELDRYYGNLILKDDAYLSNVFAVRKWKMDKIISSYRNQKLEPEDRWRTFVTVTPVYHYEGNTVYLAAEKLLSWYFNKDRPKYLNFGTIGSIIGHEMNHGFDNMGIRFDKNGTERNWWDSNSAQRLQQKIQCLAEKYRNYTVPGTNVALRPSNTVNEDIADNGGMLEAYKAYLAWVKDNHVEYMLPGLNYTTRQLFWIAFANDWCDKVSPQEQVSAVMRNQKHTLRRFRVIGPLSNYEEFSDDFNCAKGTPMNPEKKCRIW